MKRRIISVAIALVMAATCVFPGLSALAAGTVPSLEGGVYQIGTADELIWFADAVNSGTQSIKGKLTADIQLNAEGSTANEWTPIGTQTSPFKGTFDGDGHTVSGVYINSSADCVGFFGSVVIPYEATEDVPEVMNSEFVLQHSVTSIKNLKLTNAYVKGGYSVGGIVGYGENLGISDCSFSGTVEGTGNSIGGVVGWSYYNTVVNQCHSTGSLSGNQRVGGITGYANGNSVIVKCYSDMTVSGQYNVGGIIGTSSGAFLEGSFFLGSVSAQNSVGGIIGYALFSTICDAYAIAPISGTGELVGGAIGNFYGSDCESVFYSYETSGVDGSVGIGRTLEDMKASSFIKELNAQKVYFCFDYTGINNGYPVLAWMLSLDVWAGDRSVPQQNASGTYLISKPSELAWFAALVNGQLNGIDANPSANATVTDDLLMNINVNDDSFGLVEWTPIGIDEAHGYNGTFNGGGFNIAGLYTTSTSGNSGVNVGLFGYVDSGTVINTVVLDGKISGIENVGGIAGYVKSGSIMNCCSNGEVSGDKAVGGIVGNLGSSSANVSTSCVLGTIVGTNYSDDKAFLTNVGGVVGFSNKATINKCFNAASIEAPLARFTGGVLGYNSGGSLTNSYCTGMQINGNVIVGGLVGYNNNGTVSTCYVSSKVTGTSQVGVAFGQTTGANVTKVYYDSTYMENLLLTGATEKSPAQMTGYSSVSNLGFSATDWRSTADDQYFYYFPQLSSLYNLSSVKAIKDGSVSSVKRVQDKYVARVQIDGRIDTYYETLSDAIAYAENTASIVLPTVYLIRDTVIDSTITISSEIGIFSVDGATISRASTLTGAMFNVTGKLTLGSKSYGDDTAASMFVDGGKIAATDSAIKVAEGAVLTVQPGVEFFDFRTAEQATATVMGVVISNEGTVEITGSKFIENIGTSVGGVIYNNGGTVKISGGSFKSNEATQGAVLYNNGGEAVINGGEFTLNIAKLKGGVIASYDVYATTVISGKASLTENQSTYGGAVCAMNYSTVEISGGTLSANRAYYSGGAIQSETGAEVRIKGGYIAENISDKSLGQAIYNDATLLFGGNGQIDSSNDVYLVSGKTIDITDKLNCSGYAAIVTPQTYAEKTKILDGSAMSTSYMKFGLSNSNWYTLANGTITSMATTTVAKVSKAGAYSVEYTDLKDAFASVAADETAIITLVANASVTSTITVNGDVTLLCDDTTYRAIRTGSFYGIMFDITKGSTLRIGTSVADNVQQSQADYAAGTDSAGLMIIDGGKELTGVVGAAAVNVQTGGSFYMHENSVVQNCKNTTSGAITVSGNMYMYGGTVRNNECNYGGVYVKSGGKLNTYGGVIAGNSATGGAGDAVYALGRVTRFLQTYNYLYVEKLYDEEGNVIGSADPVSVGTSNTDIMIKNGEAVYLSTNIVYIDSASSDLYITSLDQVPDNSSFTRSVMTLDCAKYTVGNVIVSGTDTINTYMYFDTYVDGYCILYTGKLGINKLVAKSTAGLTVDRSKSLITGFNLTGLTVSKVIQLFENDKIYLRVYDASGTMLKNTNYVSTGCSIRLIDASGAVIDSLTVYIRGDVNGDSKIDGMDSVIVRAIAGAMLTADTVSAAQIAASDVNFDNTVTSVDAEHIDLIGIGLQTISQTA